MTIEEDVGRRRQATIVEVADRAGVAIGTVSRYLNGHPVRRGNREQIEQAIAELGYRRNAVAAAMKTDLTNTVGFMVPSLSEFHSPVLEYLSRRMRRSGRAMISYCHAGDTDAVINALDFFDMHRVDCLIMDAHVGVDDRIRDIVANGTPVVFYDNDIPGLPVDRVLVENREASYRAVSHLLDLGHTDIAVLTGATSNWTARERYEGYRLALQERGIEINPDYVLDTHWNEDEAYTGALGMMSLPRPPTALFCCNYNMTIGVLQLLKERRLHVPADISLVSFDDIALFRLHDAGITAIEQPLEKIAESIASVVETRLSERAGHHDLHTITHQCNVILRGSTRRLIAPADMARQGRK